MVLLMPEEQRRGKASLTAISSRFEDDVIQAIDQMAHATGVTRSEVLHEAMIAYLGRVNDLKILEDLLSMARLRDFLEAIALKADSNSEKLDQILSRLS